MQINNQRFKSCKYIILRLRLLRCIKSMQVLFNEKPGQLWVDTRILKLFLAIQSCWAYFKWFDANHLMAEKV